MERNNHNHIPGGTTRHNQEARICWFHSWYDCDFLYFDLLLQLRNNHNNNSQYDESYFWITELCC